ncbi:MAG: flagellar motor protein MotB, partial [Bacteroidota bacterium]
AAFRDLGLEIGSPYEYRKEIRACEVAAEWAEEKIKEYEITPLVINSAASDYAPSLYGDQGLVFTSDRSASTGEDEYNWTGESFSDLFILDLATDQVNSFPGDFNTEANEGTLALSADGKLLLFTRCTAPKGMDAFCKIMYSEQLTGGGWTVPIVLPFQKSGVNYMHPALSADGKTLFFSADDEEGWGGFDIYQVTRDENQWGEPQLLSRSVNSTADDQFPSLDADTLYFSSAGHTGLGGLDVFRSYQLPSGNWAPAFNLKTPVNSGSDDFGFIVDRRPGTQIDGALATGYFSSRRGEVGSDDLYQYQKVVRPPVQEEGPVEEIVYRNVLDIYVVEKIYADPGNPNSEVLGKRPLPGSQLTIQLGREEQTVEVGEEGKISLELQRNTLYDFFAQKEGYLNNDSKFSSIG